MLLNAPKTMKRRSINSGRLERWLGTEKIEYLANCMRNGGGPGNRWYYKPINLRDVPGSVWITADGDFVGDFERGYFASAVDRLSDHFRDLWKAAGKPLYIPEPALGVGFTSISDALSRASSGNGQLENFSKTGPTGVVSVASTLWRVGSQPVAGSTGGAAPGGTVHVSSDTGAMSWDNPASGTLHLVGADIYTSVTNNALMMYDRLFSVAAPINSTTAVAVTGVPTRYTSTTSTAMDYIGGNFLFVETGATAMAATAHNWTTCTYTDQGNAASTLPSVAGRSGAIADTFDLPTGTWFAPLAAGDVGVKALTQMQCSALVATGSASFVIGHPIGIFTLPINNMVIPFDFLTNRNQAPRIFDNACCALLELPRNATTAALYTGQIYACSAAP